MTIYPVDNYHDLFVVENFFPPTIVDKVLSTDWVSLPWIRQESQETWKRKKILEENLHWQNEWDNWFRDNLGEIELCLNKKLTGYQGTAWWLDEPGFTCPIHTDGEMPGAMQLTWVGSSSDLGTVFYHYKDPTKIRYKFQCKPNTGYIMLNSLNKNHYRYLQWHGMLTPVPSNSFRLTSYSWLTESL